PLERPLADGPACAYIEMTAPGHLNVPLVGVSREMVRRALLPFISELIEVPVAGPPRKFASRGTPVLRRNIAIPSVRREARPSDLAPPRPRTLFCRVPQADTPAATAREEPWAPRLDGLAQPHGPPHPAPQQEEGAGERQRVIPQPRHRFQRRIRRKTPRSLAPVTPRLRQVPDPR